MHAKRAEHSSAARAEHFVARAEHFVVGSQIDPPQRMLGIWRLVLGERGATSARLHRMGIDDDELLGLFHRIAVAVRRALGELTDWGLAGTRAGQYRSDLTADAVVLAMLEEAAVGVLSEESGTARVDSGVVVVVDPVDGSTNASRGIPWFATSLCAVDREGARVALVANQASGVTFTAVRGRGAWRDGVVISPSGQTSWSESMVGISGLPSSSPGWRQFRALGACALDLCAVASGVLDAYVDCSQDAHGVWDYAGGLLVCREAGAIVVDALGRELVILDHAARRTPVAGATPELVQAALRTRPQRH